MHQNPEVAGLRTGDRVKLLKFWIDEGLRLWPVSPNENRWRVVEVEKQRVTCELLVGTQQECLKAHPNAVFGINDNETVPPGTQGTVMSYTPTQVWVAWDNGRRLALTEKDAAVKIPAKEDKA